MSDTKPLSAADRRLRIELLQLQARYERLTLRRDARTLTHDLQPHHLLSRARSSLEASGPAWLRTGLRFMRNPPGTLSALSLLLATPGPRRMAFKIALIAGLVWLGRKPRGTRTAPTDRPS